MTAEELIKVLGLIRHPDGGWFIPSYRGGTSPTRSDISSIYYLLEAGAPLPRRKLTAHEIWHFYDGAPVELVISRSRLSEDGIQILGRDLGAGQRPQIAVPAYHWQSSRSLGDWSLVGCDVAPGFSFGRTQIATEIE